MICFADDSDFFRRMGESVERSMGDHRSFIIGVIVLILLGAAGFGYYFFVKPMFDRRRRARAMFDSLCVANGLQASESHLLLRIARRLRVENPAFVFVRPSLLERASALQEFPNEEIVALKGKLYS